MIAVGEPHDRRRRARSAPARCRVSRYDHILLGHGSGGRLTADLIERLFLPAFGNDVLGALEDQATVSLGARQRRRRLPGSPSRPTRSWSGRSSSPAATSASWRCTARSTIWPSAAPGRSSCPPRSSSRKGCRSPTCGASSPRCAQACDEAGVALVTGDTKVVDRGKGDQVFITTTGIGLVPEGRCAVDPHRPARRPHPGLGHDRRSRHRHHVGARGDRVRDRAGKRHRPAARPDARRCSRPARRSAACATRRAAGCPAP